MASSTSYKPPEIGEVIAIGRTKYESMGRVKDFPPQKSLEETRKVCAQWNKEPKFLKWGIRFSVGWFGDKYTLYTWERVG
jgi:hypothetical protein